MSRDQRIIVTHLITGLGVGGAERMLARLVRLTDRERFDVDVVSLRAEGPVAAELRSCEVDVMCLALEGVRGLPAAVAKLERHFRRRKPHIIQTWLYHADLFGFLIGRASCTARIVWNIRGTVLPDRLHTSSDALPRLLARISPFADAIIVNSAAGKRAHEAFGYRSTSWHVIPNGFDTQVFEPSPSAAAHARQRLRISPNSLVVGMVARLHEHKDHGSFLEAAKRVCTERADIEFVLAGTNIEQLRPRVEQMGLGPYVHLLPEQHDVAALIPAFDIATLSSWTEGFPNVIGEAMSCGVPCVVTDVGDAALLVGGTGVVVPPRNAVALAAGWLELLADPERHARGDRARERILKAFDVREIGERYASLYDSLSC